MPYYWILEGEDRGLYRAETAEFATDEEAKDWAIEYEISLTPHQRTIRRTLCRTFTWDEIDRLETEPEPEPKPEPKYEHPSVHAVALLRFAAQNYAQALREDEERVSEFAHNLTQVMYYIEQTENINSVPDLAMHLLRASLEEHHRSDWAEAAANLL